MFRLHESTRTFLCRLSFILLGLLPTCCCATYALFVNRESYQKHLAVEIGRRLNMIASCRSASHPLPNSIRFVDFEIRDPETNELLASAPILTISTNDERTLVTSPSVECNWQARPRLLKLCETRIESGNAPQQPIKILFDRVEIAGLLPEGVKIPLYHFKAEDGLFDNGREGAIGFFTQPDPEQGQLPAQIHLARSLDSNPLQPSVRFATPTLRIRSGSRPLPCALIGGTDCINQFGPATAFLGEAFIQFLPNTQTTTVSGRFLNVDLQPIGKTFSQRITGMANFSCTPLVIENGRVKKWSGSIESQTPGELGRSLANSLIQKLKIRDLEVSDHIHDIHFKQFGCRIDWEENNVRLFAFDRWQGVILAADDRANPGNLFFWQDPEGKLTTPAALLEAFKPEGLQTVPSISFLEKMWR